MLISFQGNQNLAIYKKKVVLATVFFIVGFVLGAQPTSGTTGLLNTPTASMQNDGTFFTGANYLPEALTPEFWDYATGNYYLNITFLPFMEVCYKMTLMKTDGSDHLNNQDRAFSIRFRLFREKEKWPSVVIGSNDIYSNTVGDLQISERVLFNNIYLVATKNFKPGSHSISSTLGYAHSFGDEKLISGIFGGVSWSPSFFSPLNLMLEYDTKALNAGASILLFNHLYLFGMAHDLKRFAGGFAFLIYLRN